MKKQVTPDGMDEVNARRLVAALRAADTTAGPIVEEGFGFWLPLGSFGEVVYDAAAQRLVVRRSPIGSPFDDRAELEQRTEARYPSKRDKLGDVRPEIVKLHAHATKGWFITLRDELADRSITDKAFVERVRKLSKLCTYWRA